ncbi:histidinol-phosphate transaminase [Pontimicrobium sp. MEBiC06410]
MNIKELVRENIKTLQPYASARDEFEGLKKDMIFLDANENPFNNGVNRYPDPQHYKVRELLSSIKKINIQHIMLGNGSDEVLDLIFRAFCEPKIDNVITLPPTYGMYEVLANINNIATIKVALDANFQPRVEAILEAANKNSKILFLCSPNNPTANSFESSKIEKIIKEFNGIVVIDETYIDFTEEESWLGKLKKYPNLIVTQTLSKAYGMAGIRLGICYASKEIITILNTIKPPYNINELTQQRAAKLLLYKEGLNREIGVILEEREKLIQSLKAIPFIEKIYPTDANFILIKVDDANKRYAGLIKHGIVVRNRTKQPLCENCLRITVGTFSENKKLIYALKQLKRQ